MAAVALLLTYLGWTGAIDSYEYDDRGYTIDLPHWPFYALVSFVGLIIFLQSLSHLVVLVSSSLFESDHSKRDV